MKGLNKKKFTYKDLKTVYTIVFFEKSTPEFHSIKDQYIHKATQKFDTGLNLNMLQDYVLIPLDIYKDYKHNKTIETKREAWLSFLCDDSPGRIMEIIEKYPAFREMYGEVYEICRNVEGVMEMFSKELYELDRNTVQYMIEEQQEQLDALKKENNELHEEKMKKEAELQKIALEAEQIEQARQEQEKVAKQEAAEKALLVKQVEDLKRMIADLMDNRK